MRKADSPKDFVNFSNHPKRKLPVKVVFYALFFLVLSAGLMLFFRGTRDSQWDGKSRLTVISISPAGLISYEPQNREVLLISFPSNFMLSLTNGYGDYYFDRVFELDRQEKKQGRLVISSVENEFGIQVISWVNQKTPRQMIPSLADLVLGNVKSNFSTFDLVRFVWLINGAKKIDIRNVDLSAEDLIRAKDNVDGSVSLVLAGDRWDSWVRTNMFDKAIDEERLTITVINKTNRQGLGTKAARLFENLGAQVVRVVSGNEVIDGCIVRGEKRVEQ